MTSEKWMIIEAGGKQHFVTAGNRVTANRVPLEVGATLKTTNLLDGAPVSLTVVAHSFGPKINGLKFKNKVRYLKRYGHRQALTIFEVDGSAKPEQATSVKAPAKAKPKAIKPRKASQ